MNVIERLKADIANSPRGRISEIAAATGVKLKTLRNVIYGETRDMNYSNAQKLIDFYANRERRSGLDRRQAEQ